MLGIITIHFKNQSLTDDCIESIRKNNASDYQIVVVDVSIDKEEQYKAGADIRVVRTFNRGYAHAVNKGVEKAIRLECDQFVIINNDVVVARDFINTVQLSISTHPRSIIGGTIYYFPGYEYHHDRYSTKERGKVFWYAGGLIDWDNAYIIHRGVDEKDKGQFNKKESTEFVSGCLVAFDKSVWEMVGEWDEEFFMYFEDADWCMRAKRKGIPLWYDPSIVIWHKNAQSTGGSGSDLHVRWQNKSRLMFGLKYAPLRTKVHLIKNLFFWLCK